MSESDPPLPRVPDDPENLRRLRREALRRMEEDEHRWAAVVYGGPPIDPETKEPERPPAAAVYGGPAMGGGSPVTRRWTLKRILVFLAALLAGLTALFFGARKIAVPVYGGPPIPPQPMPQPTPGPRENQPVYGGPVPPEREPPNHRRGDKSVPPTPDSNPSPDSEWQPKADPSNSSYPAAVYGGPPPAPPGKPR